MSKVKHRQNNKLKLNWKVVDCVRVVENGKENTREKWRNWCFYSSNRTRFKLFEFRDEYGSKITSVYTVYSGSGIAAILLHFIAINRQSYARYLPVYLANIQQLELTYLDVYSEFAAMNHSTRRSGQPFSPVSTDTHIALEQSINTDSKSSGGVNERATTGSKMANKHRKRKKLRWQLNEMRKTWRRWQFVSLLAWWIASSYRHWSGSEPCPQYRERPAANECLRWEEH